MFSSNVKIKGDFVSLSTIKKLQRKKKFLVVTELFNTSYCPQTKFTKVVFTGVCLSTGGLGLCPGGSPSGEGGSLSRRVSVRGEGSVWGVSVRGDLCPGQDLFPGGLCPGGSLSTGGLCPLGDSVH